MTAEELKQNLSTLVYETKRLSPVFMIVAACALLFNSATLVSSVWRVFMIGIGFLVGHVLWRTTFHYIDLRVYLQRFLKDPEESLSDAITILGLCVLRGLIYAACILGASLNIGGP
jgi:hypothetical protein